MFLFDYIWDLLSNRVIVFIIILIVFLYFLCFCAAICLCVAFADFTIQNHPQHVMGGVSNLSAVALAHQLSSTAGTNFSGGLQTYHGSLSGTTPPTGESIYFYTKLV